MTQLESGMLRALFARARLCSEAFANRSETFANASERLLNPPFFWDARTPRYS